jgi:hypothetical protein
MKQPNKKPVNGPRSDDSTSLRSDALATSAPLPETLTCLTVCQTNYLSSEAWEIQIENGVVVSAKKLTGAPDVMSIVVGRCAARLWEINRNQKAKDYK